MINLTDSLSACTASGILAYAKQIYHQMSGGTETNVEDLLNEHEAKIDRKAELSDKGSLVLGNANYATNKESIVGGTGVYQRGARGFGFGYSMFALYLTGDGNTVGRLYFKYTDPFFYTRKVMSRRQSSEDLEGKGV